MNAQGRLLSRYLADLPQGRLEWIGVRPERKAPMVVVEQCQALEGMGLQGDRRLRGRAGSGRQVSLISREFMRSIAAHLGRDSVDPALLRRNLVVSGINLNALRYQYFQIGEAIFQANALCQPCSRMEQALGDGAVVAMLGYGGLCLRVVRGGCVAVGDALVPLPESALPSSLS
ncbi:MOSC domain-containing protein [uncultured Spongiibacter sp.]|mgnify:FL=1|uniref:MOSC domain-containing protein n=1 Tax=uncultured Spongiibacter sp. TaxID=870896 RepID=UPI0025938CF1|nr:MOSC domain-containing protein [uncultured Spongiibacter sp.]